MLKSLTLQRQTVKQVPWMDTENLLDKTEN